MGLHVVRVDARARSIDQLIMIIYLLSTILRCS